VIEYEVTEVPPGRYAVIKRTVPFAELPQVMSELLGRVHEAVPGHGRPMCISSLAGEAGLNIAAGWEAGDETADLPEPVELVETPAQRAAVHLHVGPYEGLAQAYQDFGSALVAAGLTPSAEPREIYESPPDDPNPTTRIIWPLEA
jgi:effector-binding domain-containing protein